MISAENPPFQRFSRRSFSRLSWFRLELVLLGMHLGPKNSHRDRLFYVSKVKAMACSWAERGAHSAKPSLEVQRGQPN